MLLLNIIKSTHMITLSGFHKPIDFNRQNG